MLCGYNFFILSQKITEGKAHLQKEAGAEAYISLFTGPCTMLHGIRDSKVMERASGSSPQATLNKPDAVTVHGP